MSLPETVDDNDASSATLKASSTATGTSSVGLTVRFTAAVETSPSPSVMV